MWKQVIRSTRYSIIKGVRSVKYSRRLNLVWPRLKDPALWRGNRISFARAGFIGIFCAFTPMPFQMPMAAIFAYYARAHIPFAIALAWITNPVTMWPIWTFGYLVGTKVLGVPPLSSIEGDAQVTMWAWLTNILPQIWIPLWFGNMLMGFVAGLSVYLLIRYGGVPGFLKRRRDRALPDTD